MSKPTLYILAGANGSGKTTVAELLLPRRKIAEFVNADEIARGLSPFNPTGQRVSAGKLMIGRLEDLLNKGVNFAIETTLSGRTLVSTLIKAKNRGYRIQMFYLYTSDIRVNLKRIKYRVKQGGHDIPAKDVRRRYKRSLSNLFQIYYDLCDIVIIYDNTKGQAEWIAYKLLKGEATVSDSKFDLWKKMKKQAE